MCLLERVIQYDSEHIVCGSYSHLQRPHALEHQQRIAAVHLCEYGAQAAAVHGALLAAARDERAPQGWLVALRDVQLVIDYLDEHPGMHGDPQLELHITARLQHSSAGGCMYAFDACLEQQVLVSGKATIMNWTSR